LLSPRMTEAEPTEGGPPATVLLVVPAPTCCWPVSCRMRLRLHLALAFWNHTCMNGGKPHYTTIAFLGPTAYALLAVTLRKHICPDMRFHSTFIIIISFIVLLFYVFLGQWYWTIFCPRTPRCNFSSTLYPQRCWCTIQVIHSL
jgi:hypothetical protein